MPCAAAAAASAAKRERQGSAARRKADLSYGLEGGPLSAPLSVGQKQVARVHPLAGVSHSRNPPTLRMSVSMVHIRYACGVCVWGGGCRAAEACMLCGVGWGGWRVHKLQDCGRATVAYVWRGPQGEAGLPAYMRLVVAAGRQGSCDPLPRIASQRARASCPCPGLCAACDARPLHAGSAALFGSSIPFPRYPSASRCAATTSPVYRRASRSTSTCLRSTTVPSSWASLNGSGTACSRWAGGQGGVGG